MGKEVLLKKTKTNEEEAAPRGGEMQQDSWPSEQELLLHKQLLEAPPRVSGVSLRHRCGLKDGKCLGLELELGPAGKVPSTATVETCHFLGGGFTGKLRCFLWISASLDKSPNFQ